MKQSFHRRVLRLDDEPSVKQPPSVSWYVGAWYVRRRRGRPRGTQARRETWHDVGGRSWQCRCRRRSDVSPFSSVDMFLVLVGLVVLKKW